MSRIVVEFGAEELEFDLEDEAVVGSWSGPRGLGAVEAETAFREAVEHPLGHPPLRHCVAPGDRVAIAMGPGLAEPARILGSLTAVLGESGVAPGDITVITPPGVAVGPTTAKVVVHDPADREQLAYLASTTTERRVYLNRILVDADFVLPIGLLGYDPLMGRRGPWSILFPGMSDAPTLASHRRDAPAEPSPWDGPAAHLDETFEVGWLLGSQFQIGVIPGARGPAGFVAGRAEDVRDQGAAAVDRSWRFRASDQADVVVVGIGGPGSPASLDELVEGLATASRLTRHGGRIVALSRASGPIGPSLQRLVAAGDSANLARALRGFESDPDSVAGGRLARVLAWADVHLLSGLDPNVVEDLSMIPLGRPEEARRLVERSAATTFLSRAELAWGEVAPAVGGGR